MPPGLRPTDYIYIFPKDERVSFFLIYFLSGLYRLSFSNLEAFLSPVTASAKFRFSQLSFCHGHLQ